ncbi:MAG: amidohydrolase family protein, partial [Fimbriimonadaceae bacterium]|nr:amidohydrolase family protein [Fimbriimonadaceae bacterium]
AKAGVPCSLTYVDAPGGKLEAVNVDFGNAAELARAGVSVGFNTDDGITDSRFFIRNAAMAMRYGLPRDEALRSLTLNPAKHIELDHRIGSLRPGKDADFIVLDGDPFSVYTRVQQTYIEGHKVFDFGDPADRKFALGGEGSRGNGTIHLCCAEAD